VESHLCAKDAQRWGTRLFSDLSRGALVLSEVEGAAQDSPEPALSRAKGRKSWVGEKFDSRPAWVPQ